MHRLIILGTLRDPHVTRVIEQLGRLGVEVEVIDFQRTTETSITVDRDGSPRLSIDGTTMPPAAVVWDRVKFVDGVKEYSFDDTPRSAAWRVAEWRAYYRLIVALYTPNVYNSLRSRQCLVKPYQQVVAAAAGFRVPRTLVTNQLAAATTFATAHTAIAKSLSEVPVAPQPHERQVSYSVMTVRVSPEQLAEATDDQLHAAPQLFQEYIAKQFELRIVVVDHEFFAFRIRSQDHRSTQLDWRNAIPLLSFEPFPVDDNLRAMLTGFLDRMGLLSGSFDLIVDPHGEPWFLECNQDGQWAWLDDVVDGAIARAFARAFARKVQAHADLA